jgi:hypothetical protein
MDRSFYMDWEMHMGGCGGLTTSKVVSYTKAALGIPFGKSLLPFDTLLLLSNDNNDVSNGNNDLPNDNNDVSNGNNDLPNDNNDVPNDNNNVSNGNNDLPNGIPKAALVYDTTLEVVNHVIIIV